MKIHQQKGCQRNPKLFRQSFIVFVLVVLLMSLSRYLSSLKDAKIVFLDVFILEKISSVSVGFPVSFSISHSILYLKPLDNIQMIVTCVFNRKAKVTFPANIYLFEVNSRNTRKRCEECSKLTIKTPERRSGVFIANFEHISYIFQYFYCLL